MTGRGFIVRGDARQLPLPDGLSVTERLVLRLWPTSRVWPERLPEDERAELLRLVGHLRPPPVRLTAGRKSRRSRA